jgi:hypothetical protein
MNNTRGSTPPNRNCDLTNLSTDLNKTLGIIGTPHEESITKFNPTKTCPKRRNRRNPAKNTSNPTTRIPQNRAPLLTDLGGESQPKEPRRVPTNFPHQNPKIEPLYSRIWEGNHNPKNHEGFPQISPIKYPRARSRKHPKEITKRGLRKSPPRTTGNNTSKP